MRLAVLCILFLSLGACETHRDAVTAQTNKSHSASKAPATPKLNCKTTSVAGQIYTFCQ